MKGKSMLEYLAQAGGHVMAVAAAALERILELADLVEGHRAQIEALEARIAQLEATATTGGGGKNA